MKIRDMKAFPRIKSFFSVFVILVLIGVNLWWSLLLEYVYLLE